jgi:2-dehydro-3-deoxyphosphogluconate aldolase/(4S)-4-hydroxy-2-oxoglutarate aldolase
MNQRLFSWESFNKAPLIGIVRNISIDDVHEILPLFQAAGLTTLEITMNTAGVDELIKYALDQYPGLNIGAGTVCNKADLKRALDLGAQFIVTPVVATKVIKKCVSQGVPIFSGAYTPTEIYKAWSLGASMVKVYPATSLGPDYIRDVKAPLKQIKLLPTGGVNLENLSQFRAAGADGYGIGGQLFPKKLIEGKNWQGLKTHFANFVDMLCANPGTH